MVIGNVSLHFCTPKIDIGNNNELKIELSPKHVEPVYAQNQPTTRELKDEMLSGKNMVNLKLQIRANTRQPFLNSIKQTVS